LRFQRDARFIAEESLFGFGFFGACGGPDQIQLPLLPAQHQAPRAAFIIMPG
jgi:hypothetical protein